MLGCSRAELEAIVRGLFNFQTKSNSFADPVNEFVERMGLGVAASESGNRGDVVAVFVPFDHDAEFATHEPTPLAQFVPQEEHGGTVHDTDAQGWGTSIIGHPSTSA